MESKYTAPALEKGLDIIELLSWKETGLTQIEIARELDRSVSEIFRMLMVLVDRGYIAQNIVSDRYQLTSFLFEVSNRTPIIKRLTAIAYDEMCKLAETCNQSVHMGMLSGNSLLVIAQKDSPGTNVLSVKLGAKIDMWSASSAWVILAFQPQEVIDSQLATFGYPSHYSIESIHERLVEIRRVGMEVTASYRLIGVTNLSVPILDYTGKAIASLTIPYIERVGGEISLDVIKKHLKKCAESITKQISG